MTQHLNTVFHELKRTRRLVAETSSLDELHQVVYQLMHDALAYSNGSSVARNIHAIDGDASLDELIEALANICIALLDSHDIPRDRLLVLVDKILAQQEIRPRLAASH